jgi:hypothetical protein
MNTVKTTMALSPALFRKSNNADRRIFVNPTEIYTGQLGAMGFGICDKQFRGGSETPPKYSAAAKLLDLMLISKSCNCISSANEIYGEITIDNKVTRFTCDGTTITYEGERLHGGFAVVPLVLFSLRNDGEVEEMKIAFDNARETLSSSCDDKDKSKSILYFCDTFYYAIAKPLSQTEIFIVENALDLVTVQKSVDNGDYSPMSVFSTFRVPNLTGVTMENISHGWTRPSNEEFLSMIKENQCDVPFEWNESQVIRIPAKESLENFTPSETFYSLVAKIKYRTDKVIQRLNAGITGVEAIGKDYINSFITGNPGTGKTTLAYALGAATNMPVYTVAITKNTEEDTFSGMNKVVDGSLQFVSTDFLEAYTNGGIILLEEINLADPSVIMGALGQAVEFPFVLMKDGYQPVHRHPLCVIIGTMNVGTAGSRSVNEALASRFRQSYMLNDPTKEDFLKILMNSSGAKKSVAEWVYNAYIKIHEYLKNPSVNAEDICLNITLRSCIGAIDNISEGENAKQAIINTLVGKVSEVSRELADNIKEDVVNNLPRLRF